MSETNKLEQIAGEAIGTRIIYPTTYMGHHTDPIEGTTYLSRRPSLQRTYEK